MTTSEPMHLVLGASGQIGFDLVRQLAGSGRVVGLSRPDVNLEDLGTVRDAIRHHRPSVIWNAAAATAVDALENDHALAEQVNAKAPGVIAEESLQVHAILVHFSTEYVFDGLKAGPYVELDATNPLNVYGRSKLAGERAVQESGARYLVLRTSWVYSSRGRNFVRTILERAADADELRVVCDQFGAPTWSRAIAQACALIAPELEEKAWAGVLHMTSRGSCSWFDMAVVLQHLAVGQGARWRAAVKAVTSTAYGSPTVRPLNSMLSNQALFERYGVELPHWRTSLEEFIRSTPLLGTGE